MTIDKKELAKLSPEERIKKLQSMEEDRKKEVNEIERLINESMREIKTDKIAEEFAPQQKVVDISRLFETKDEHRLERTARKEATAGIMKGTRSYQLIEQLKYDYTKLKTIDYNLSTGADISEEDRILVGKIGERVNIAEGYIPEGEKYANMLNASKMVLNKLKKETGLG